MPAVSPILQRTEAAQIRYRDNFARHLLGLSLHLQRVILRGMQQDRGHTGLKLSFEPYLNLIGPEGARLSDLAAALGISRQAANQAVNQIEAAGYLRRDPDPGDRRAKRLMVTEAGYRLRLDGAEEAARAEQTLRAIVGEAALRQAKHALYRLNRAAGPYQPVASDLPATQAGGIVALLPRLADHVSQRLMELTIARGHPQLKRSFGQVLGAIGPAGGRIQQMAEAHDISKQAISAIATELEELGYIYRDSDRTDGRQVLLRFTGSGRTLIADSVASLDELQAELADVLQAEPLTALFATLREWYRGLQLERDVFGEQSSSSASAHYSSDLPQPADSRTRRSGSEQAEPPGGLLLDTQGAPN